MFDHTDRRFVPLTGDYLQEKEHGYVASISVVLMCEED